MPNPIFDLAQRENERLKSVILTTVAAEPFREFLRNLQVMEITKDGADAPGAPTRIRAPRQASAASSEGKTQSEAARVRAAAKAYLSKEGERRTSGQIAAGLIAAGVDIGGDKPGSRVSAPFECRFCDV